MNGGLMICILLGFVVLAQGNCPAGTKTDKKNWLTGAPICCKFPFKYKTKEYNSCTLENSPNNYYWCSTWGLRGWDSSLDIAHVWKGRCVDGGWGNWNPWPKCSKRQRRRFRTRECNSPAPDRNHHGAECVGSKTEYGKCPSRG